MTRITKLPTKIHDSSQAILLCMVVIMAGWSVTNLFPHKNECMGLGSPLANNVSFGLMTLALTAIGGWGLTIKSLPMRAACLVLMSLMTGLIANAYLMQLHYNMDCLVYIVLTLQSWWAIFTLPVREVSK